MMLKLRNIAGTFFYPMHRTGNKLSKEEEKGLHVFVPDGTLEKQMPDWVCTIEDENGAVIIETREQLFRLIHALELAMDRHRVVEQKWNPPDIQLGTRNF